MRRINKLMRSMMTKQEKSIQLMIDGKKQGIPPYRSLAWTARKDKIAQIETQRRERAEALRQERRKERAKKHEALLKSHQKAKV